MHGYSFSDAAIAINTAAVLYLSFKNAKRKKPVKIKIKDSILPLSTQNRNG